MRLDQLTKAELTAEQDALYDALIGGLLGERAVPRRSPTIRDTCKGRSRSCCTIRRSGTRCRISARCCGSAARSRTAPRARDPRRGGALGERLRVVGPRAHRTHRRPHRCRDRSVAYGRAAARRQRVRPGRRSTPRAHWCCEPISTTTSTSASQPILGDEQLIEVTAIVGYYAMLALQMRVFRIAAPEPVTFA